MNVYVDVHCVFQFHIHPLTWGSLKCMIFNAFVSPHFCLCFRSFTLYLKVKVILSYILVQS